MALLNVSETCITLEQDKIRLKVTAKVQRAYLFLLFFSALVLAVQTVGRSRELIHCRGAAVV
jgi:hypothetical protein